MIEPDFICYDKWPGPHNRGIDFSGLQGIQIHAGSPVDQNVVNWLRGALDRGLIVSPRDMLYDHKIT